MLIPHCFCNPLHDCARVCLSAKAAPGCISHSVQWQELGQAPGSAAWRRYACRLLFIMADHHLYRQTFGILCCCASHASVLPGVLVGQRAGSSRALAGDLLASSADASPNTARIHPGSLGLPSPETGRCRVSRVPCRPAQSFSRLLQLRFRIMLDPLHTLHVLNLARAVARLCEHMQACKKLAGNGEPYINPNLRRSSAVWGACHGRSACISDLPHTLLSCAQGRPCPKAAGRLDGKMRRPRAALLASQCTLPTSTLDSWCCANTRASGAPCLRGDRKAVFA